MDASQEHPFVEVSMTTTPSVVVPNVQNHAAIFHLSNSGSLEITTDALSDFLEGILAVMAFVKDAIGFKNVYIVCGTTDLCCGGTPKYNGC